jgi:phage/conjugal plasmid C-4 type zinc finger TraR family protein
MDVADMAEIELDLAERERQERISRLQLHGVSRTHCAQCEEAIPEGRRLALPGVRLCIDCAEFEELRG